MQPTLAEQAVEQGPDYFEAQFPKATFPLYSWPTRPPDLPTQVWTTETTHRDGQQGGLPLTTEQSLRIYEILCRFTRNSGAIRQAEFFVYRRSDLDALREAQRRFQSGLPIEPTTWIRAATKDVKLIQSLGVRESGLLASISDYHVFHKFSPGGRKQAAALYLDAIQMTLDNGIRPRLHLEDATRASMDFILYFVDALRTKSANSPEDLRPKFRVCDTLGLGLPDQDVPLPRGIPKLFRELVRTGLRASDLEFHPHNDTGLITANCLAAIRHGCGVINGTCLGKGERTGNAPLEQVLMHLIGMGFYTEHQPDFTVLNELAELYAGLGQPVAEKAPLYGRDAHRTRAGIHADGLNKFWWMYAPFDVPRLLGRPLEVSLTKESGLAGLIFAAHQHLGGQLAKDDPQIRQAYDWMVQEFDQGRQTAVEWEEIARFFTMNNSEQQRTTTNDNAADVRWRWLNQHI
jgi:isopropylmalate/homocitrate/citramalate synthase